ncbi:hypothetical protein ES705_23133 [subsurface metagenome]
MNRYHTPMIVTPNSALITDLRGSVGALRFQRHYRRHLARRRWTIRAPATDAQTAHRLCVARAAALYGSVKALVYPAWLAYAAGQAYGPFACWQALNITSVRLDLATCVAPPNAVYAPITEPDCQPGLTGQIDATWTYAGPAATHYVALFVRATDAYEWTLFDTVDAEDQAPTITGLGPADPYEVALVAHTVDHLTFAEAYHELLDAGAVAPQDFDTWLEYDPSERITPDGTMVSVGLLQRSDNARITYDFGVDYFGPAFEHSFRFDWEAAQEEACGCFWAVSNIVHSIGGWLDNNYQAVWLELYRNPVVQRISLKNSELGLEDIFDDYTIGNTYYPVVERTSETAVEARIYNDADHTDLKHKHEVALTSGRRYRYASAINSLDRAGSAACQYRVRNLIIP